MLDKIVNIINNNSVRIENGTLYIDEWKVSDKDVLQYLYDNDCFENNVFPEDIKKGDIVKMELSLAKLCGIGFYDSCDSFIAKNKYELRSKVYYIYNEKNNFLNQYNTIQDFITSIKSIARHLFKEIDVLNAVVSNEKYSVVINCNYTIENILKMDEQKIEQLSAISKVLCDNSLEKRNLFINEIIEFVPKYSNQLSIILENIEELYKNCENAYRYYISGYSSNKLKFEINTKAIEYTSRIQTVINEAQTKLIAIPSAFVLAALAMDFDKYRLLLNVKNVVTVSSLFVFAVLIQLFISNQKNILRIIKADVDDYKSAFDKTKIELLSQKFSCVDDSLEKQQTRLCTITTLLWIIPSLLCLYLIISQFI